MIRLRSSIFLLRMPSFMFCAQKPPPKKSQGASNESSKFKGFDFKKKHPEKEKRLWKNPKPQSDEANHSQNQPDKKPEPKILFGRSADPEKPVMQAIVSSRRKINSFLQRKDHEQI